MKKCIRLAFLFPTLLAVSLPLATAQAQPHIHGDRTHTHGLPAQGIGHKHGNTAPGRAVGGKKAAPRAQAQQQRKIPTKPNQNRAQNNCATAGNPNAELKEPTNKKTINVSFKLLLSLQNKGILQVSSF